MEGDEKNSSNSPPSCALTINNNLNTAEIATVGTEYENSTFVVGEGDTAEIETVSTEYGNTTFVFGDEVTIERINTLKKLQEMLRIKDKKVAELKALLAQRDAEIQELRRKLEMYRNVLPLCSSYGSLRKYRPQGDF